MKKDELGNRIKENYENRTRIYLPRRTYTVIRIDGKSFGTYTRGLTRPFDMGLIEDMDETACYLCKNIQGAKFGFVQSDEISILLTDFDTLTTDAWFDGNVQKIVSVAASMATAKFNQLRTFRIMDEYSAKHDTEYFPNHNGMVDIEIIKKMKLAEFDARTYTIPCKTEVANYILWRQIDTVRNSISSVAQSLYSHSELNGVNTKMMQELIHQKGQNWNDYDAKLKRGRFIEKLEFVVNDTIRNKWMSIECPTFSQQQDFLYDRIPENN
jgi:tRNA(His) 5'-end guanylyltransferase